MLPLSVSVVVGSIVGARMDVGLVLVGAGCAALALAARVLALGRAGRLRTRRGLGGGDDARARRPSQEADRGAVSGLLSTAAQVGTAVGVAAFLQVGAVAACVAALAGAVLLRPRRAAVSA